MPPVLDLGSTRRTCLPPLHYAPRDIRGAPMRGQQSALPGRDLRTVWTSGRSAPGSPKPDTWRHFVTELIRIPPRLASRREGPAGESVPIRGVKTALELFQC